MNIPSQPSAPPPDAPDGLLRGNVLSTPDLSLAAYLLLRGAMLEAVDNPATRFACLTLTHEQVRRLVNDYYTGKMIFFSPKAFIDHREALKKFSIKNKA